MYFKAPYQEYEWCYERYIKKRLEIKEISKQEGYSMRVLQKWIHEKFKLKRIPDRYIYKLNDIQKDIIIGSLLGDGHINKVKNQPIFIVSHAENQKDYLYWKYNIFSNLCNKEPTRKESYIRKFKIGDYKCQPLYRFTTKIIAELEYYKNLNKIETINLLNELSFCVFMLDDGYRGDSNWSVCVASFDLNEKYKLIEICRDKFLLNCHIQKDNRYILFDSYSSKEIDDLILKNIPNELDIIIYKILKNSKIRKLANYVYVIKDNKKIGISTYYKKKNVSRNYYMQFRKYLLKNNIFSINELDLINLEKDFKEKEDK